MDFACILDATSARTNGPTIIQANHDIGTIVPSGPAGDPYEYAPTKEAAVARAGLNIANGRVAVFSAREVPWHGLGVVTDGALSSADALQLASLANWGLEKIRQHVDFNSDRLCTDSWAIVRTDTDPAIVLGTVGSKYAIVTNEDCFEVMDSLGADVKYETAGALGNGETVWMLSDLPGSRFSVVPGDDIETKLLCSTAHDGSGAVKIFGTSVRPVCANTHRQSMADWRQRKGITIRHTQSAAGRVADAHQALAKIATGAEQFAERAQTMARHDIAPVPYFAAVLDNVLATTIAGQQVTSATIVGGDVLSAIVDITDSTERLRAESSYARAVKRRGGLLDDILERYESERNPGASAWSAYNAVSESVDHGDMLRYKGSPTARAERRFESAVYGRGDEIKQVAFTAAADAMAT